jgi:hypothetical protein
MLFKARTGHAASGISHLVLKSEWLADPGCSLFVEGSNSGSVGEQFHTVLNDERQAKRLLLAALSKSLTFPDQKWFESPALQEPSSSLRPKWHRVFGEAGAGQPFAR